MFNVKLMKKKTFNVLILKIYNLIENPNSKGVTIRKTVIPRKINQKEMLFVFFFFLLPMVFK